MKAKETEKENKRDNIRFYLIDFSLPEIISFLGDRFKDNMIHINNRIILHLTNTQYEYKEADIEIDGHVVGKISRCSDLPSSTSYSSELAGNNEEVHQKFISLLEEYRKNYLSDSDKIKKLYFDRSVDLLDSI